MRPTLLEAFLFSFAAAAPAPGGICEASGGSCARDVGASLLQVRSVPSKRGWHFSDYAHDSNNPLDDGHDRAQEPAGSPEAMMQERRQPKDEKPDVGDRPNEGQTPVKEGAEAPKKEAAANKTTGAAAGKNASAAIATDNATGSVTRVTTAAPATAAPAKTTAPNSTCVTKKDDRIKAWTVRTSPEGTACVFGVDPRDEGSHCVFENQDYGSNGWCYTSKDKGAWGSCAPGCPLSGPFRAISSKIDGIASDVKRILRNLSTSE